LHGFNCGTVTVFFLRVKALGSDRGSFCSLAMSKPWSNFLFGIFVKKNKGLRSGKYLHQLERLHIYTTLKEMGKKHQYAEGYSSYYKIQIFASDVFFCVTFFLRREK
jgi:hypothetical protein